MSLNIKHTEVDRLARLLLQIQDRRLQEDLLKIGQRCANLPDKDPRSSDDIIGYDSSGVMGI